MNNSSITGFGDITAPVTNNGDIHITGNSTNHAGGPSSFVQNGTLTIDQNMSMGHFDSGGGDYAVVQTGGVSTINGTWDIGHGIVQMQGGTMNIGGEQNHVALGGGFDSGGGDLAYVQTGGVVNLSSQAMMWNPGVQGGQYNILPGGSLTPNATSTTTTGDPSVAYLHITGGAVDNNGTIDGNAGVSGAGLLTGGGLVAGDLSNGGLVSPGNSPGTLTIDGDYTQLSSGTLLMQIAGDAHDLLSVGHTLHLAGTLEVELLGGFMPTVGERFELLDGTIDGSFSSFDLPTLSSGESWDLSQLYSNGSIGVVPEPSHWCWW